MTTASSQAASYKRVIQQIVGIQQSKVSQFQVDDAKLSLKWDQNH